jgi:hypothetical protein
MIVDSKVVLLAILPGTDDRGAENAGRGARVSGSPSRVAIPRRVVPRGAATGIESR